MRPFRFRIRSLILLIALLAVVLTLRDRLDRRWYACAGIAAQHSQRARAYEALSRRARSQREEELARCYLWASWWHDTAAWRHREAAFKFYLPRPNVPLDLPPLDRWRDLALAGTDTQSRPRESLTGPQPVR